MKGRDVEFNDIDTGESRPYMPDEGIYPARFKESEYVESPWGKKLRFTWEVFTCSGFDQYTKLFGYYNVKTAQNGRLKIGAGHSLRKDFIAMNYGALPQPPNSLSFSSFIGGLFFVEVITVDKDSRGSLHPSCRWSRVRRVIRPLGVGEQWSRLPIQLADITWKAPLPSG